MTSELKLSPKEISERIRTKVADINDDLILAGLAEVDVEFTIERLENAEGVIRLRVWCSQEVR